MKTPAIIFLFLIVSVSASAQIERKPAEMSKTDTAKLLLNAAPVDKKSRKDMMKDLDLTREQRSKLKELRESNNTEKTTIENNMSLSEMEKKKKLRELKKEQTEKMMLILTPEQREKFKAGRQNNP